MGLDDVASPAGEKERVDYAVPLLERSRKDIIPANSRSIIARAFICFCNPFGT